MRKCFLTGCYSGLLPKAPGTWRTLFGALLAWVVLRFLPQSSLFLLTILLTVIATREINAYEKETKTHDDPSIVVDEMAGFLVAMAFVPLTPWSLLAGFVLFRALDIFKPPPINAVERRFSGGLGIVGDDLIAGLMTNALLQLIIRVNIFS